MSPSFEKSYCPYCGEGLSSKEMDGRDRKFCQGCDRFIWRNASPVSAVIVERNDEILFVKRGIEPGEGEWSLPAGFIEYEEQPEKGAVRELVEETGLKADPEDLRLVDALNIERFPGQRLLATVYSIDYLKVEGSPEASDDAVKAKFWNIEKLRKNDDEELRSHFMESVKNPS